MGERYYMACVLSLAVLAAVIFLAWTNGLNRFNPAWMVAASTMVIMVWVIYGAMWLSRLCVNLEKLLRILMGQRPRPRGSLIYGNNAPEWSEFAHDSPEGPGEELEGQ